MFGTCEYAESMSKMIQLRHVSDELHRKLKIRAARVVQAERHQMFGRHRVERSTRSARLFVSERERIPPGAVPVLEFWKQPEKEKSGM